VQGNALIPLATPPSSSAFCERLSVPERRDQPERSFADWLAQNLRQEPAPTEAMEQQDEGQRSVADRKAFRDTMADFVSRVYGAALGLTQENVVLPAPYLTPFAYALFPSLIASTELMLRPSIPNITLPGGSDQSFAPDYAVDRWEALKNVVEGTERRKEADYTRTVMNSLFCLEEITSTSASSSPSSDALLALRKLIFGLQSQSSDSSSQASLESLRLLSELKRAGTTMGDDDDSDHMQPFLSTDMFSLFVSMVLLQRKHKGNSADEFDHLLRLLFTGTVLQALVTIVQLVAQNKSGDPGLAAGAEQRQTPLEKALRVVANAMLNASPMAPRTTLDLLGKVMNQAQLEAEVKRLCLPFLYRVALFQHFCLARPLTLGTLLQLFARA
jgi:hypothetical protein